WEAADRMYFDGNKVQLQFFDAGEVRQGDEVRQEIILMAAANDVVQDHLDILAHARLEPLAIDVIPAALARFVNALPADQQQASAPPGAASPGAAEPRVILDVGRSASKVL